MKKTWLKIKEFKFTDLKKTGQRANKGVFRTSPWINNIVGKFCFEKKFLPIELVRIKVKDLGYSNPVELKRFILKQKQRISFVPQKLLFIQD